jgi:hypothetical protein
MPNARSKVLVIAACGALLLSQPREAQASDFSIEGEVIRGNPAFVVPIALDVGLTVYDVATLINDQRGDQIVAIAETVVALPQLVYGATLFAANIKNQSSVAPGILALWTGALLTHGAVVLVMGPPHEGPKPGDGPFVPKQDHPHISIVPTMLGDEARSALVPGVVAFGRF